MRLVERVKAVVGVAIYFKARIVHIVTQVFDHAEIMGVKFDITSYRVWALRAFKRGVLDYQTVNFLHKWPNLQGRLELI